MSSSGNNNSSRKGKGRQKVEMMKIENESNLQVTFSKRRTGLFKKASELSTLCGAETALVVFSPGNKAHSFGHPNVDTITNRFLNQNVPPMSDGDKLLEAHQKANINQQTLELNQLQKQLELEQKRSLELQRVRKEGRRQGWCPPNSNKLNYQQLDQLKGALLQFRHRLETKVHNATNFQHPDFPRSVLNPSPTSGNRERLVLGRPSPRVRFDDGVSGSNASIRINPKANNLGVGGFTDATTGRPVVITSYDPMAGDSSLTIPYSSTATTSTIDANEPQ